MSTAHVMAWAPHRQQVENTLCAECMQQINVEAIAKPEMCNNLGDIPAHDWRQSAGSTFGGGTNWDQAAPMLPTWVGGVGVDTDDKVQKRFGHSASLQERCRYFASDRALKVAFNTVLSEATAAGQTSKTKVSNRKRAHHPAAAQQVPRRRCAPCCEQVCECLGCCPPQLYDGVLRAACACMCVLSRQSVVMCEWS